MIAGQGQTRQWFRHRLHPYESQRLPKLQSAAVVANGYPEFREISTRRQVVGIERRWRKRPCFEQVDTQSMRIGKACFMKGIVGQALAAEFDSGGLQACNMVSQICVDIRQGERRTLA